MAYVRLISAEREDFELELKVLSRWFERLRGLLGSRKDMSAVMLMRCSSIHTYGMSYPIDVALVGECGQVLKTCYGLEPCKVLSHPKARCVLERPAELGPWPQEGEHLWATSISADGACC